MLDTQRGTLFRDGAPVLVGQRGLSLLQALLSARGETVTKAELMELGWPNAIVEESNLSVQIAALRKLLGSVPDGVEWIVTVPRVGYRIIVPVAVKESNADELTGRDTKGLASKPSIAVLPFANLSGDIDQEYFADGISEDITIALSRFRWFFVVSRNSSFLYKHRTVDVKTVAHDLGVRYVLEGSARRSNRLVRVSAQLIDARSATQIWGDRFDFDMVDMLAVQDRIAEQVAGAIEPELLKTESALGATRRRASNLTAWDLVRQGTWYFHQVSRATHRRARELFREACALDDNAPDAQIWVARVSAGIVAYGWSDDPAADLREGMRAALRAIQVDEQSPYSHYALAIISVFAGPIDRAIRAAERAVELNPSFALGHLVLGMARLYGGDASGAIAPLEYGLRLNRYDPQNFVWYNTLAYAYFFSRQVNKALQCTMNALKIRPTWPPLLESAACCYMAQGRTDAARELIDQGARLEESPGDAMAPFKRNNLQWTEEINSLLAKATRRDAS
jgi:TolB-like protein